MSQHDYAYMYSAAPKQRSSIHEKVKQLTLSWKRCYLLKKMCNSLIFKAVNS